MEIDIEDLTIWQVKEVVERFGYLAAPAAPAETALLEVRRDPTPFDRLVGKNVFIRTVTMFFTGRLVEVFPQEIVITDATWIADTKRWSNFIANGVLGECEPYPDGLPVIIGRSGLIDATEWLWPLPRTQK